MLLLDRVLPLLDKELTEQASRTRTYAVRVLGAMVLYGIAVIVYGDELLVRQGGGGQGKNFYEFLAITLFVIIFVALPAVLAGSISSEIQRGTLQLLRLSGMSEWAILWQKLLSAMAHLLTWILLCLPLLAVAYTQGGVEAAEVPAAIVCLLLSALQIGSLSIWVSSQVHEPGRALLQVYVRGLVWYIGLLPVFSIGLMILGSVFSAALDEKAAMFIGVGFFPPLVWGFTRDAGIGWTLLAGAPSLVTVWFFLWQAKRSLRDAVTGPKQRDPDLVLRRAARGNTRKKHGLALPRPVAWLERGRLMATFGSLNLSVVLTIGVFALVLATFDGGISKGENISSSWIAVCFWFAMLIGIIVVTAASFSADRGAGTHEVLLTTPLAGRDIIVQKMAGGRRIQLGMLAPLAYVWLFQLGREDLDGRGAMVFLVM